MLNDYPRQQLKRIITHYGVSVCHDFRRCEALLRDYCPEHKRELNLLIAALKEGVPQQLMKPSPHVNIDFTLKLLARTLHDNLGTAENFAFWAVESWAFSLDVLHQQITVTHATNQTIQPVNQTKPVIPEPISQTVLATPIEWRDPITGMEFIQISKGRFMMGSPAQEKGRYNDEVLHNVDIKQDFYLGKYLVSQAQWQAIMGNVPFYFKGDNLPVDNVNWLQVQEFIELLNQQTRQNYRLPTEAEWEYACRAGTSTPFYTGTTISNKEAKFSSNVNKTMPIGSYPPNPWGLYDMVGNVWEWTGSTYSKTYDGNEQRCADNDDKTPKALRGGSWLNEAVYLRSAARLYYTTVHRGYNIGFRLVRE